MTKDKDSQDSLLKPQFDFSPNSEDRSSTLLTLEGFQAVFHAVGGESYSCEDNKVRLSGSPTPRIHVTSTFSRKEAERLNQRYSKEPSQCPPGKAIAFSPRKVSLNDRSPIDMCFSGSDPLYGTDEKPEYCLKWAPTGEDMVVTGGSSTKMKQVIFHLFNFVRYDDGSLTGKTNIDVGELLASQAKPLSFTFNYGKWAITISQNSKHYPVHVGRIQRKDRELFDEKEVKKHMEMLGFAFSFVRSAWCKPSFLVGYDALGKCVWRSLSPHPEFKYSMPKQFSWDSEGTKLGPVISSIMNKIHSEAQENQLQQDFLVVIELYVNASSVEDSKDGIIKAQTAIEYICCHFKVSGEKLDSKQPGKKYERDDFRKLFHSLRIPLDKPQQKTSKLQELVDKLEGSEKLKEEAKRKSVNILRAFNETRNSIVHSRKDKNIPLDDERFLKEIWDWGLESVYRFITTACESPWATAEQQAPALNDQEKINTRDA